MARRHETGPGNTVEPAEPIKHNKNFDLLVIPGAGHGPGGAYGEHKRYDFFVQHLLGVTPPPWSEKSARPAAPAAGSR